MARWLVTLEQPYRRWRASASCDRSILERDRRAGRRPLITGEQLAPQEIGLNSIRIRCISGAIVPALVTSGLRFNLDALFGSASTIALVPIFLAALLAGAGSSGDALHPSRARPAGAGGGLLQATSLIFIVAAAQIGMELGELSEATGAAMIAAGLLSVLIFPLAALTMLRTGEPAEMARPDGISRSLTAGDRIKQRAEIRRAVNADDPESCESETTSKSGLHPGDSAPTFNPGVVGSNPTGPPESRLVTSRTA